VTPLRFSAYTLVSALGIGLRSHLEALLADRSGLRANDFVEGASLTTWIGRVDGVEDIRLPEPLSAFDCRNNRLVELALQADNFEAEVATAREAYGPERVGLFIGTSTSGILECEQAYLTGGAQGPLPEFHYATTSSLASATDYLRRRLRVRGPVLSISTACSSSAKALVAAQRAIEAGLCDAAIAGGVDSLCLTTLYGFNSLELVSNQPCKPFALDRGGISIGEAAGLVLLTRERGRVSLVGHGESSDAHHISSPHPGGLGAVLAMRAAIDNAGITAQDISYVHLHGTGTRSNDLSESNAVRHVFTDPPPTSSTKAYTGHTLGAAGAIAALFSALMLENEFIAGLQHGADLDPTLDINLQPFSAPRHSDLILVNAFGFGGSNCSLVLGQVP
jgi:3-oxoacyl-[acyl-carrier-protein] synthase-1